MIKLTDERIDAVLGEAYTRLVAETGYNGGMAGETWDRAAARAIEAEVLRINGVGGEAVAWLYTLFGHSGEIANREASTVNWDERYQPFGRPGIDFHEDGVVRKEPLYTQPQQAAPGAVLEGWQPIETAENDSDLVAVFWLNSDGEEMHDLDYTEDGCWVKWHDYAEHVEIIGGHGVSYTAPYTHWKHLGAPKPQGE